MGQPVKSITIVGGGTAGWLAANMLITYFNPPGQKPRLKVTLIESPNIKTIGVGEATVPAMPRMLQQMGISEREFFRRCNASFKLGVNFINWNHTEDGKPVSYINPFNSGAPIKGHSPAEYFQAFGRQATDDTFADDIIEVTCPARDAIDLKKGPRPLGGEDFSHPMAYAYHLDAGLFAEMLRDVGVARGVEHIRDDVEKVNLDERGFVSSLSLKERPAHPVQLVIDCTGFRGLVINKAMGEEFIPYSNYLMNDRALAVQIPHKDPTDLEPCTRSTALGAGWTWNVPLYSRVGTGYVFSSAHRTDEEATKEFLAYLGKTEDEAQPRAIPIRVGRTRNAFVKNCVAIGLSSGFIEPLESTAIYMIEMGIRWLFHYFPDTDFNPALAKRYNDVSSELYDEVRDFIVLHYALNNRTDSDYWIEAREKMPVPDSLTENLEVWKHALPFDYDLKSQKLFTYWNYMVVLFGKGFYPRNHQFASAGGLMRKDWETYIRNMRAKKRAMMAQLPGQYDLLQHLRNNAAPGWAPGQSTVQLPGLSAGKAPLIKPKVSRPIVPQLDDGAIL